MGEDDPGLIGVGAALRVPAVHKVSARDLARLGHLHHAMGFIGMDRLAGTARRQRPGRVALPVLMLPAYRGDLGRTVALGERAERRTSLDRLQLLGIADQHNLRPRLFGARQHPLHLPRTDHARFVDHQHVTRPRQLAALFPLILKAGDRPRGDSRAAFQILRRDSRQRRTAHDVTGALPFVAGDAQHGRLAGAGIADDD